MKGRPTKTTAAVAGAGLLLVAAVCWHSVEEIHYLKTFFPARFTVREAFLAGALELVKVVIICIPAFAVIAVFLYFWRHMGEDGGHPPRKDRD